MEKASLDGLSEKDEVEEAMPKTYKHIIEKIVGDQFNQSMLSMNFNELNLTKPNLDNSEQIPLAQFPLNPSAMTDKTGDDLRSMKSTKTILTSKNTRKQ